MKARRFVLFLLSAAVVAAPSFPVCQYESALARARPASSNPGTLYSNVLAPALAPMDSGVRELTIRYTPREEDGAGLAKLEPETGAYLGAYVLQDDFIGQSMERFNEWTGVKHASFFKYVGYGQPFPSKWVEEVKAAGAFPQIAWEPNRGLDEVKDDEYLQQFAQQAQAAGVPILLRFASEMNGTWTSYSGDPRLYKEKWRLVHDVFEEEAPNAAMLWSVLAMPEKPMADYYPGDEYVDWVGVNIYSVRYHNGDRHYPAGREDPLDLLNAVYNQFSRKKPIAVSEFGASHYSTTDGKRDIAFAAAKLRRLYGSLEELYPRVKAVYYFDVNNISAFNPARRVNDYSITGEQALLVAYREATASDYYTRASASAAGVTVNEQHGESQHPIRRRESYTFRGKLAESNGIVYADESFFTDYLGLALIELPKRQDGKHWVRLERKLGHETISCTTVLKHDSVEAGYTNPRGGQVMRKLRAIAVLETVRTLGYEAAVDDTGIRIKE